MKDPIRLYPIFENLNIQINIIFLHTREKLSMLLFHQSSQISLRRHNPPLSSIRQRHEFKIWWWVNILKLLVNYSCTILIPSADSWVSIFPRFILPLYFHGLLRQVKKQMLKTSELYYLHNTERTEKSIHRASNLQMSMKRLIYNFPL